MRQYEGYTSYDSDQSDAWVRVFCAELPDKACGLLLFQHHLTAEESFPFDYKTEANLGLLTGSSLKSAVASVNHIDAKRPVYGAAMRRLARLLTHGDLTDSIQDTLSERGLERAVAYSTSNLNLDMFERAGFKQEHRDGLLLYTLDL